MTSPSHDNALASYLAFVPRGLHQVACDWLREKLSYAWVVKTAFLGEEHHEHANLSTSSIQELEQHLPKKRRKYNTLVSQCCVHSVGVIPRQPHDMSFGYRGADNLVQTVWTTAGKHEGTVWLKLQTNAPVEVLAKSLRAMGPLLSLAGYWDMGLSEQGSAGGNDLSVDDALKKDIQLVSDHLNTNDEAYRFEQALNLWKDFAKVSWGLTEEQKVELEGKVKAAISSAPLPDDNNEHPPLLFRLSCVRTDSKKYKYKRQEFLTEMADYIFPSHINQENWKVNLTKYDVEIVLLVRNNCLAIGMALRPYQKVQASSFQHGDWPPDISKPYYRPNTKVSTSNDLVRLRPATAQLLLHLCQFQAGDVVLDPCVGLGTLVLETLFIGNNVNVIGFGGDLVLTKEGLGPVAADLMIRARQSKDRSRSYADLIAWDACCLPIRAQSVDVIVSDLPFGQSCSSSSKLEGLLPLLVSEWARVLKPETGRMVLLCGTYSPLLQAMVDANEHNMKSSNGNSVIWQFPCTALFPVNIGGTLAWVLQLSRGGGDWFPLANQKARIQKLISSRNRDRNHQHGKKGKQKRLQA